MARFLLLNGPNLNLLGKREPEVYGKVSLSAIEKRVAAQAKNAGHQLVAYQSNSESDLVDRIQQAASEDVACIMLNPAAFTHTSVALRDALLAVECGAIIPPVGLNLFAVSGTTGVPLMRVIQGSAPFVFPDVCVLVIVLFFPILALWLPSMLITPVF